MGLIQDKQLSFVNGIIKEGIITKQCISDCGHYLASYVSEFSYWGMDELNETLEMLEKALNGQFDDIEDGYIGKEFWNIEITLNGVEVYGETPPYQLVDTYTISEFKDMLTAWKVFLLTPPLAGTKIN